MQPQRRCEHKEMPHYSDGLCKKCYLSRYYLLRKKKNLEKQMVKQSQQAEKVSEMSENCNNIKKSDKKSYNSSASADQTTQKSKDENDCISASIDEELKIDDCLE